MATENVSVAAAFDLSYDGPRARPAAAVPAAGAAPGHRVRRLRRRRPGRHRAWPPPAAAWRTLYDQYLLTEIAQGRYRMHDLIRQHARTLADRLDPDDDREQAVSRLLDYYQHTAALAESQLARRTVPGLGRRRRCRPRSPSWPAGSRRWPGPGPNAPACWPAWTTPPRPASTPGSSR